MSLWTWSSWRISRYDFLRFKWVSCHDEERGGGNSIKFLIKKSFHGLKKSLIKFYPLHLATLLFAVVSYKYYLQTDIVENVLLYTLQLTLLQSWSPNRTYYSSLNAVSWYLSTYLFIIAIAPFVLELLSKLKPKGAGVILFILLFFRVTLSLILEPLTKVLWNGQPAQEYSVSVGFYINYTFPPLRLIDYISGCLLFIICDRIVHRLKKGICEAAITFAIGISVLLLCINLYLGNLRIFDAAIWYIPVWIIIFALACGEEKSTIIRSIFGNPFMVFLGNVSFEFYLIHCLVLRTTRSGFKFFGWNYPTLVIITALIITIVGAIIIHYLQTQIERQISKKRNKKRHDPLSTLSFEETAADVPVEADDSEE